MTKVVLWSSSAGDIPANLAFTNNFAASAAPGVNDDITSGYTPGSVWIYSGTVYMCSDSTEGAAVWDELNEGGTTPGQIVAPAASTPTGTGGAAKIQGGTGGTTSGAGGASSTVGGAATAGNSAGGAADTTGGAGSGSAAGGVGKVVGGQGGATGAGGKAQLIGGAGGATSGNGGDAEVTGGAATAGNGNGGNVVSRGGAKHGTGIDGILIDRSFKLRPQGAPAAATVSATLTAANLMAGIITVNQAGGAVSAQQLPLAADLDTAIPAAAAGDSFDFSVINTSTVDAEDASITTNTGWTLVGNMDIPAYSAAGSLNSSGLFRARKTGAGAWVLYRIG